MKRVYLAGPLFSQAERQWLVQLRDHLREKLGVDIFWSWEQQGGKELSIGQVFDLCKRGLDGCDAVVAVLDGASVDDGTAWEIGYFYALGKGPIIGLRTDFRKAGELPDSRVNAVVEGACSLISSDLDGVVAGLSDLLRVPEAPAP